MVFSVPWILNFETQLISIWNSLFSLFATWYRTGGVGGGIVYEESYYKFKNSSNLVFKHFNLLNESFSAYYNTVTCYLFYSQNNCVEKCLILISGLFIESVCKNMTFIIDWPIFIHKVKSFNVLKTGLIII